MSQRNSNSENTADFREEAPKGCNMKITGALILVGFITFQLLTQVYWENQYGKLEKNFSIQISQQAKYVNSLEKKFIEKYNLTNSQISTLKTAFKIDLTAQTLEKDSQKALIFSLQNQFKEIQQKLKNFEEESAKNVKGRLTFLESSFKGVEERLKAIEMRPYNEKSSKIEEQMKKVREALENIGSSIEDKNLGVGNQQKSINKNAAAYTALPLNLFHVNNKQQRIQDALYSDEETRTKRAKIHADRIKMIDGLDKNTYMGLQNAKYNQIHDFSQIKSAKADFEAEWERLEKKFNLSQITNELPICIISPGYNNNAKFRIEYSLNSMFTQNYTNYKAIIINDASTDGSHDIYQRYFDFYNIDPARYTYIQNAKRITALENIYNAIYNHCSNQSITIVLDADDEFIGRNVLKVFNWAFITKKSGVIYSNFIFWNLQQKKAKIGYTTPYTEKEKSENLYREILPSKFSHLRAFRTELFLQIDKKDLLNEKGQFYTITYDQAIFLPMLEMSCGRVEKIQGELHYIYNIGTGLNDNLSPDQYLVDLQIRKKKKYQCNKAFDEKMKKLP